jgi:predicted amidohydrolase
MANLTITLAQINVQPTKTSKNFEKVAMIIQDLVFNQSIKPPHLILLPELWSSGFTPDLESSARQNEEIIQNIVQMSTDFQVMIGGSYIHKNNQGGYTNTFKLIIPNSTLIPSYDKIHLFSQMNEIDWFQPGKQPSIVDQNKQIFGLSICYDLRFPDLYRNYANHKVELCLLPAQWPSKRIDHFTKLIQARSIENQFFFAGVNTVGKIGNTHFGGSSMITDPYGNPIIQLSATDEEIVTQTIDLNLVKQTRKDFPVLSDQSPTERITPQFFVQLAFSGKDNLQEE